MPKLWHHQAPVRPEEGCTAPTSGWPCVYGAPGARQAFLSLRPSANTCLLSLRCCPRHFSSKPALGAFSLQEPALSPGLPALRWEWSPRPASAGPSPFLRPQVTFTDIGLTARDNEGATALHFAARGGHTPILDRLLLMGAPLMRDSWGGTPLHDAAENGQLEVRTRRGGRRRAEEPGPLTAPRRFSRESSQPCRAVLPLLQMGKQRLRGAVTCPGLCSIWEQNPCSPLLVGSSLCTETPWGPVQGTGPPASPPRRAFSCWPPAARSLRAEPSWGGGGV